MNDAQCSTWIFQANPNQYDLPEELAKMSPGDQDEWRVNQNRDKIQFGDVVLLWSASGGGARERGFYGIARVNGDLFRRNLDGTASQYVAPLRLEKVLDESVLHSALDRIDALSDLSILNYWQGTNFPVTQQQWELLVEHFPQLGIDLSEPPERVSLPPSRKEELQELLVECLDDYDWQSHLDKYAPLREQGQQNYEQIIEARDHGEDITDLVLEKLLPHIASKFTRETGRWIHQAPSINKDIKTWYEGSGWTKSEDWPEVSRQILAFIERCVEHPGALAEACKTFSDSPVNTGFQTGTLSPILNALEPDNFLLINNKSRRALNYFAGTDHSQQLEDYPAANDALRKLVIEASDILSDGRLQVWRPDDVFDMFTHWLAAEKKFDFSTPEVKYWKVAPGAEAWQWDECRDGGFIAIGWGELGDIAGMSLKEFYARRDEYVAKHDDLTNTAVNQVWRFSRMSEGDIVIANQGISRVIGIGVVTGEYYYDPSVDRHPHRIPIEWTDTTVRQVDQPGWRRTFVKLNRSTFEEIDNAPIIDDGVEADTSDRGSEGNQKPSPIGLLESAINVILFGPPGTGKTWSTAHRAVDLCLRPDTEMSDEEIQTEYRRLSAEGRIEFVTFHQSYAYEEFVEGIRPVMTEDEDEDGDVRYRCEPGSFKKIALRAAAEGVRTSQQDHTFERLWQNLLERVRAAEEDEGLPFTVKNYKDEEFGLTATKYGNLQGWRVLHSEDGAELSENSYGVSKTYARPLWEHREELGSDYGAYSYQAISRTIARELGTEGGCHGQMLWAVHFELLKLAEKLTPTAADADLTNDQRIDLFKDFLVRGERSQVTLNYADASDYVLVIDEINRGNISKILGELITLLEPSKRLTEKDELIAQLPYSKERFAVPPNLHIIGTMNTADRSIALMDVALRRRFTFEEMLPDWQVIRDSLEVSLTDDVHGGKDKFINLVVAVFENINARIRFLYDEDHQLGHSYFMGLTGYETLRKVFLKAVIPLLQEYFYGSWERVCLALGCPYDARGEAGRTDGHATDVDGYVAPLVQASSLLEKGLLGMDHDDFEDQQSFAIDQDFLDGKLEPAELQIYFEGILSGEYLANYNKRIYSGEAN